MSLFLRGEREIFRYVAALVSNVADAEGILQKTPMALWGKFDAYDPAQPFTPWACRLALNKTRQSVKRPALAGAAGPRVGRRAGAKATLGSLRRPS